MNQPALVAVPVALRDPVFGVVQRACLELEQLLEQRREIKRRMKSLRHALRGLQQGVGGGQAQSTHTDSVPVEDPVSTAAPDLRCGSRFDRLPRGRSRLHRACRIALLEAGGTATPEEVYLRILRRGSFSFRYRESPVAAISRVLEQLDTKTHVGADSLVHPATSK